MQKMDGWSVYLYQWDLEKTGYYIKFRLMLNRKTFPTLMLVLVSLAALLWRES